MKMAEDDTDPIHVHIKAMEINKKVCGQIVLRCIVSIHLYSASQSAHQSEALPVRETQRYESRLQRTKIGDRLHDTNAVPATTTCHGHHAEGGDPRRGRSHREEYQCRRSQS